MSELLDAIKHNRKILMLILGGIFIIASFEHIESVLFFTLGIAIIAVDIIIESESKSNQTPMMSEGMNASCHTLKDIFSAVGTEDIFNTGVGIKKSQTLKNRRIRLILPKRLKKINGMVVLLKEILSVQRILV